MASLKNTLFLLLSIFLSTAVYAQQKDKVTFYVSGVLFNMVYVEGGDFLMGPKDDADLRHMKSFYIGETEVTQELWETVMYTTPSKNQSLSLPVESVRWIDCEEFILKLNHITGLNFRLPYNSEWEYAARGGQKSKGYKFSGSNKSESVAWEVDNSGGQTHHVGTLLKNELGIYDMSGNVEEWCQNHRTYTENGKKVEKRSYSGGSYKSDDRYVWFHYWDYPSVKEPTRGFRLVIDEIPAGNRWIDGNGPQYGELDPVLKKLIDNMVPVEGGSFMMGLTPEQVSNDDLTTGNEKNKPPHQVTLSSFRIGKYELTQEEWCAIMDVNHSHYNDNNKKPANCISWDDAQVFIRRLNRRTGLNFRLPTEAEWEYAARGGNQSKGYRYSGSNKLEDIAWNTDKSQIHQVGTKAPNELGLYDMSGNVAEWCQDWLGAYTGAMQYNPTGPSSGTEKVYRGGAYHYPHIDGFRVSARNSYRLYDRSSGLGLRLVLPEENAPVPVAFDAPQIVDMGLSVKWASMNLGAASSEETGYRFAWGETVPKGEFNMENYKWAELESTDELELRAFIYTKYNYHSDYYKKGSVDGKMTLEPEDDAAHVNLGGKWRMPSADEWNELRAKCEWIWTSEKGVGGFRITSKINGNSIFLPATSPDAHTSKFESAKAGNYWSNTLLPDYTFPSSAHYFYFYGETRDLSSNSRQFGYCIRPIYDEPSETASNAGLEKAENYSYAEPQIVDIGLSVKWASFNLGATKPDDYGLFFSWGETTPKARLGADYSWKSYKWCKGTEKTFTKYNKYPGSGYNGLVDNKMVLDPEDDAAHVNLGGHWRMPTLEEMDELQNRCKWEWSSMNGVSGFKITGPNGKMIFLPAGGYWEKLDYKYAGSYGFYFSSTMRNGDDWAAGYAFSTNGQKGSGGMRCWGMSIRPVFDGPVEVTPSPKADTGKAPRKGKKGRDKDAESAVSSNNPAVSVKNQVHEWVDLGLSVNWATCNVGANSPEERGDAYAWGETSPKDDYTWENYVFNCGGNTDSRAKFTKYKYPEDKQRLDPSDDVVRIKWGGNWRMPTKEEMKELRTECNWTWTTENGVLGCLVQSKQNGNSIFLPKECYWSSDFNIFQDYQAYSLYFNELFNDEGLDSRYLGFFVRPVCDK